MKNRSYIRIASNKANRDLGDVGTFTTVETAYKMPRARRRRTKDKKRHSNTKRKYQPISTALSPIKFDEPSIVKASSLSVHSAPFKPRAISQRPAPTATATATALPFPLPLPLHTREHYHRNGTNATGQKRRNVPFHNPMKTAQTVHSMPSETHGIVRFVPEIANKPMKASPVLTARATMKIKRHRHKKQSVGKPPGLKAIDAEKNNNDADDERKSISFLNMLDSIDTDGIFNDIVNHQRNYDFPKSASGIFVSDIWQLSAFDDDSNWDVVI